MVYTIMHSWVFDDGRWILYLSSIDEMELFKYILQPILQHKWSFVTPNLIHNIYKKSIEKYYVQILRFHWH